MVPGCEGDQFRGHALLVVPEARRFFDPTVQQFAEVPAGKGGQLPVIGPLPPPATWLGADPIAAARNRHTVIYHPQHDGRELWQHDAYEPPSQATADVRQFGEDIAGEAFMLLSRNRPDALAQSPYLRPRALYDALGGAEGMLDPEHGPRFRLPNGSMVRLHEAL